MRISKAPEIRRQEILDTAMRLFYEKGYEQTSMADIAKEMQVVQGLCYRYFSSKQELYQTARKQYVEKIAMNFIPMIHDTTLPFQARLQLIMQEMVALENSAKYHDFYHKKGNEQEHVQLSLEIANHLLPHFLEELQKLSDANILHLNHPKQLMKFMSYGLTAFTGEDADLSLSDRLALALHYIQVLIEAETI